MSLWALARMRHDPGPKFVARAISVIAGKSASLQPIDVAQTLWSSVELGYLPGEKSRKVLLDLVDRDAAALDAQQLNMVAFALSRMKTSSGGEVPDALAQKLVSEGPVQQAALRCRSAASSIGRPALLCGGCLEQPLLLLCAVREGQGGGGGQARAHGRAQEHQGVVQGARAPGARVKMPTLARSKGQWSSFR